jgi:putative tryptophan/tyrosine transport system substrate-binding protein
MSKGQEKRSGQLAANRSKRGQDMDTKAIIAVGLAVLVLCAFGLVEAQQAKKIPRVGVLSSFSPPIGPGRKGPLRQALSELGYVEGKDIVIEYRYLEGDVDRTQSLVAELVQLKVDVLVLSVYRAIRIAKQATNRTPIVMVTTQDPVATGLIDSLARPGGNITGLTLLTRELSGKRLELLKEVVPRKLSVGVLEEATLTPAAIFGHYETAARTLKIPIQSLQVNSPHPDFERAFQTAAKKGMNAVVTASTVLLLNYRKTIAEVAIKYWLPSMFEGSNWVDVGGLMSYAADDDYAWRRAAIYVDKILKGAKPTDLPVEQPMKLMFVINLKTAKRIGVTIPPNVLARADKVLK